jgi:hypothetical protein
LTAFLHSIASDVCFLGDLLLFAACKEAEEAEATGKEWQSGWQRNARRRRTNSAFGAACGEERCELKGVYG